MHSTLAIRHPSLTTLSPILLILLLAAFPASAQVTTGTPPFGSFSGGPDVINLANLNSHISVPILNKPGRGMNFTYDLSYDSSVWYPVGSSGSQIWQPVSNWGWRGATETLSGYVTSYWTLSYCYTWVCQSGHCHEQETGTTIRSGNWVYHDPFGIPHPFAGLTVVQTGTCGGINNSSFQATATDGSGYSISVANSGGQHTVISSSGSIMNAPWQSSAGASTTTDRNGNQISVNSSGVFTDTLGTTALTVTGSGTPGSPYLFTYTAPSGASASYTMKYTTYGVETNFGCSNIGDYGTNGQMTANLVSEIDLPDIAANANDKYTFTYEATPGHTGFVTGRLASVTLPTGGTITYTYTGGSSGNITCADGSAATLTRAANPGGTWTYAHSESGTAWTTLITDPQNNQTNMQFQGIYETQRQVYQGSVSPSNLLETVNTCYNNSTSPCTGATIILPITQRAVVPQFPSGLQSIYIYNYNSFGLLTNEYDHDYGPGGSNPLNREVDITFAALGNNINAFKQTVTVKDGTGNIKAATTYNYDETGVVAPPNQPTPQHTTVSGSRGNLTSIVYPVSGLKATFSNYDTGQVQTSTDVNGAQTTYTYGALTATCGNAFPTSVSEPLSMLRSMTWNCTGGVQTSSTDENNQVTSATYNDPDFWRPASVADQQNNVTSYSYLTNPNGFSQSLSFNGNQSVANTGQGFDGLGRPIQVSHIHAPGATAWDQVVQSYDSNGRLWKTSAPCVTTGPWTCPTTAQTTTYDALNRIAQVTDAGGGSTTYTYNQNDVLVAVGPAPSGEHAKQRQLEYDSLGRLTSVCELTTLSGSGNCGQTSAQTGYWTKYTYDALGDLLTVTQNAQATSANQQTRSYAYDAMSRLTSETNPESGTKTYVYDSDSTMCGNGASTSRGDLVKTVDATGNCVMRYYDLLHRVEAIGNNNQSASNPCRRFLYDNTSGILGSIPLGITVSNKLGHLVEAETDICASPITQSSIITDEWFSYTARGENSDVYEATAHSGAYYHASQTYWPNGGPNVMSGSIGLPTITYGADGEGRPSTTSASSGQNPVTSTAYNLYASPNQLSVTFGSGDSDVFTYDSNTFRLNKYQFNVGSQAVTGTLGWNANWSLGSLNISDPFSTANTQSCSFAADDLSRISQVSCGTIWGQNFSYDPFGNIQKNKISGTGASSFTPTYQSSPSITNRVATVNGTSATYDANGNSLNDTFRPATWDADSNPISIGPVTLTYDAFDRMVEQSVGGTYSEIVYSPAGVKLALMHGTTLTKAFVPLPGGATAVYTSSGLAYYRHTDHLGSSRFASTPTQTLYSDTAYSPFGEPYASSGAIDNSFTGQNQDTTAGLYDFLFREQDPNQGRWTSPDPAGTNAVDPANPQTWNRFAYVANMPLGLIDPLGLCPGQPGCPQHHSGPACIDVYARANCSPLPPWVCNGQICGNWQNFYDPFGLMNVTVVGYSCMFGIDCHGVPGTPGAMGWGPIFGPVAGLGGNSSGGFSWMGGGGNSSDNNKTTQLKDFNACVDQASSVENRQLLSTSAEIVGSGFVFVTVGWLSIQSGAFLIREMAVDAASSAPESGFLLFSGATSDLPHVGLMATAATGGIALMAHGSAGELNALNQYDRAVRVCQLEYGFPNVPH